MLTFPSNLFCASRVKQITSYSYRQSPRIILHCEDEINAVNISKQNKINTRLYTEDFLDSNFPVSEKISRDVPKGFGQCYKNFEKIPVQ